MVMAALPLSITSRVFGRLSCLSQVGDQSLRFVLYSNPDSVSVQNGYGYSLVSVIVIFFFFLNSQDLHRNVFHLHPVRPLVLTGVVVE